MSEYRKDKVRALYEAGFRELVVCGAGEVEARDGRIAELEAALDQQQEAEPVAWVDEEGRVVRVSEDGSGDGGWVSGHDRAIPDSWTPLHPPKPAEVVADVRCEGCGYMTHHREHMGCVRAAQPQVPEGYQLVPVQLIEFIEAKEFHLPVEDRHVLSVMLSAAKEEL